MQFKDIIGQQSIKKRLIGSVNEGRISHAQLFAGPEGCGGLALAIAYAQYIACKERTIEDSCGKCPSCIKYDSLAHPDLHFAYPITSAKENETSLKYISEWREAVMADPYLNLYTWIGLVGKENQQGIISVHESAEILRRLSLTSFEGGYKVMIIWMPEKMNIEAANKLLKILEEPMPKTLFVLVTEGPELLLSTIISRTQIIKIGRIADEEMKKALMEGQKLSEVEAERITYMADGNYEEALKLVRDPDSDNFNFIQFRQWMRNCFGKEVVKNLHWVEGIAGVGRERQKNFLDFAMSMMRETMLISYADDQMVRLHGEELEFAKKFSPYVHGENIIQITDELNRAARDIERNANPKILFTDLSFKLMVLLKQAVGVVNG